MHAQFLGLYGAREAARVGGGAVERWLGTPRLVSGLLKEFAFRQAFNV